MSKDTSRSNERPSDKVHAREHASTDTQGTPLPNRRANTWGKKPSSASAAGKREYERQSAQYMPKELSIPPTTTAAARVDPPYARPASTHAPVSHVDGSTRAHHIAAMGTTYVSATRLTDESTAIGYARAGRSTSAATVDALSQPM